MHWLRGLRVCSRVSGFGCQLSGVRGRALEKHRIKRVDRLLGNHRLCGEQRAIYAWMARWVLGPCRHPVIIVDWSDIDTGKKLFLLRAAVCVGGRALPVYEEVHGRYHHRSDTTAFLHTLAGLLPKGCQPIIVTDAGFKTPWFRTVQELGWYYVGRVRSRDYVRFPDTDHWISAKSLYERATSRPKALGALWRPRSDPMLTWACVYRRRPKGRVRLSAKGQRRRNGPSLKHEQGEREPWLLVTNLAPRRNLAKRVVAIYRDRMTIEEAFRDLKAHRHGFAFRQNLGRNPQRVANLLLLAAIGTLCAWLTGLVGHARDLVRTLQANTERRRRVLSVFFVGNRLIKQGLQTTRAELTAAIHEINKIVQERTHATT